MAEWKATREAIIADRRGLDAYYASVGLTRDRPRLLPLGFAAILLYRIARYLYINRWRRTARLVWVFNISLTGADLGLASSIGKGLVIPSPRTVTIYGQVGENCTFHGQSGIGGVLREASGLPVVGDNVSVMAGSLILGPIRIGDGVFIGPRCTVTRDIPADAEVWPLDWPVAQTASP